MKERHEPQEGRTLQAAIDRQWPHQVALKAPLGKRLPDILEFCRRCGAAPRHPSFRRGDEDWVCIAFKVEADAHAFRDRFGGTPMKPAIGRSGPVEIGRFEARQVKIAGKMRKR